MVLLFLVLYLPYLPYLLLYLPYLQKVYLLFYNDTMKEHPNRTVISFKVDENSRKRLEALSGTSGRTMSTHARDALKLYLDLRDVFYGSDPDFATLMKKIIAETKKK